MVGQVGCSTDILWKQDLGMATVVRNDITVTAKIGDSFINVSGKEAPIDTKAILKENRTYLPARAVLEAFGYTMKWSDSSKTVYGDK